MKSHTSLLLALSDQWAIRGLSTELHFYFPSSLTLLLFLTGM